MKKVYGQMKPGLTCIKQQEKKTARDLKHVALSARHGGGNVIAWAPKLIEAKRQCHRL